MRRTAPAGRSHGAPRRCNRRALAGRGPSVHGVPVPETATHSAAPRSVPDGLPATFASAALRGMRFRCPRCNAAPLFARWLKPVERCSACGQDWSHQRADDFPAWIAIILTGHLLAPLIIALVSDFDLAPGTVALILFPAAIAMMLGLLQPAKGLVITAQWWHGLNGFSRERPPLSPGHGEDQSS